jgi:hypothetical protein
MDLGSIVLSVHISTDGNTDVIKVFDQRPEEVCSGVSGK